MPQTEAEVEGYSCEIFSNKFFLLCGAGGFLACSSTHLLVTPLDVIKCRMQADPIKYKTILHGVKVSLNEGGPSCLVRGWAPTTIGYGIQGAIKFGGYEVFKWKYANMIGEENAYRYRTMMFLAASASAEFLGDIFLAPFEATKVRIQTQPTYTSRMAVAMPHIFRTEGIGAFFKGLPPLWGRQMPYTMIKFVSFEKTVTYLYTNYAQKPKEQCTKSEQLMITFLAGYIAGILCAIASHPSDVIVSKLNKDPSASMSSVISNLGFMGMWGGLGLRICMIGTMAALQWLIYDGFKVYTRLPRPALAGMPASLQNKLAEEKKKNV